ncbi:MAG: ribonuclease [Deltaproteobacteria bacterium]|nr:ribonuclease [Deltaproteobacteria bacterium]
MVAQTELQDPEGLEAILGYTFRDRSLLEQAVRHTTWCNEQREPRPADNERLEFLGDAVLGLAVGHRLMQRFPDGNQGNLSITRAQVVSEQGLSEVAGNLALGRWLLLGRGEDKTGGRTKPRLLADTFEAVVGAVYLDGGFTAAWQLVDRLLTDRINAAELKNFYDFKSRLQEAAQARLKESPQYRVLGESGPDHDKQFEVAVLIGEQEWGRAIGNSKQKAEQLAAAEAHLRLEGSAAGIRPKR